MDNDCFVVVCLLKGRRFPKRPKCQLVAEGKFSGDLVQSDPVEHSECPNFSEELAWVVDRRALQQHHLQRSSAKIQFYCQSVSGSSRELIGYAILDLRSAGDTMKENMKWYSVLNTKYSKSKPEVLMSMYVDRRKSEEKSVLHSASPQTGMQQGIAKILKTFDSPLKPVLNNVTGVYHIGPENSNSKMFSLSVVIALATNLIQLIPSHVALDRTTGFFFYYILLGCDVTTRVFYDLANPEFAVERVVVKMSSSLDNLRLYFNSWSLFQIHFCCGGQPLGTCYVPVESLPTLEIEKEPATIEGIYQLFPCKSLTKKEVGTIPDEMKPVVGVSMTLSSMKKDEDNPDGGEVIESKSGSKVANAEINLQQNGILKRNNDLVPTRDIPGTSFLTPMLPSNPSSEPQQDKPAQELASHHFSFSIDLRFISGFKTSKPLSIVLRYLYEFFGTNEQIVTEPVEVAGSSKVVVPKSFCTFDFATSYKHLEDALKKFPLIVGVCRVEGDCLGVVRANLSEVLEAKITKESGCQKLQRCWSNWLPVISEKNGSELGSIQVCLTFDDHGLIPADDGDNIGGHHLEVGQPTKEVNKQDTHQMPSSAVDIRDMKEFKVALELEMWREKEKKKFEMELAEKRKYLEKKWEDEFRTRERERVLLVSKEKSEYETLNERLRKTLSDLERREKLLVINEDEFAQNCKEMERQHERETSELRDASKRFQDNSDHQVSLQKKKLVAAEESIEKLKKELSESDLKYRKLSKEFDNFREKLAMRPEVKVQAELTRLTLEKVNLEKQLGEANSEKNLYKQHWTRTLKVIQRYKDRDLMLSREEHRRQQEEIEKMKLEKIIKGEKGELERMESELEGISKEVKRLNDNQHRNHVMYSRSNKQNTHAAEEGLHCREERYNGDYDDDDDADDGTLFNKEQQKMQLIEERDQLLKTGLYTDSDPVIIDFNRKISAIP